MSDVQNDERRIRGWLRRRVDGTPPVRPGNVVTPALTNGVPAAPEPESREPDWLDQFLADEEQPGQQDDPAADSGQEGRPTPWWSWKAPEPEPATADGTATLPAAVDPNTPVPVSGGAATPAPAAPTTVQPHLVEIQAAAGQVLSRAVPKDPHQRRRVRYVLYNGLAAGAGYAAGLGPWMGWSLDYYGQNDPNEGVFVGLGVCVMCLIAEVRTHGWRSSGRHVVWQFLGWIARIPLATAVLALALYGTPTPTL